MCTLTFIPKENGYLLAMNRDERIARGAAAPPVKVDLGNHIEDSGTSSAIYPRDNEGGTWIAANDRGIAFALLNWNDVPEPGAEKTRSRGCVIVELLRFGSYDSVHAAFDGLDLRGILPFRLIGIFPEEKIVAEWRWGREDVESHVFPWQPRQWFSSGLSDEQAAALRGTACQSAWKEEGAGSITWLRKLHASHVNGPGPFSVCVHRENVETLSYTEILCTAEKVECGYFAGTPCTMRSIQLAAEMARAF